MDVHEVATGGKNKTFIQNKTIILKLECTINNESIEFINLLRTYYTRVKKYVLIFMMIPYGLLILWKTCYL